MNSWLSVLTELQNRDVQDILIACIDGLKGLPDAINTVFTEYSNSVVYRTCGSQLNEIRPVERLYPCYLEMHDLEYIRFHSGQGTTMR